MRNSIKLALGASALALTIPAMPASAATFFFDSGIFTPGVNGPSTLTAPDILEMSTSGNKIFNANYTNQSGTVNWNDGAIFLGGGAILANQSLWNAFGNNALTLSSGGTFNNSGIFRKSGGTGVTDIIAPLINSGTFDAQSGTIRFSNQNKIFNSGTVFTGAGTNLLEGPATFNGAFTSDNLDFLNAGYTGNNAALNGSADFLGGTFNGDWTVTSGSNMNFVTGGNKIFSGSSFTNDGTINWENGTLFMGGGVDFSNAGLLNATGDNSFTTSTTGTLTNTGTILKSGSVGTTDIISELVNSGTLEAQSGTLRYVNGAKTFDAGTVFTGAGTNLLQATSTFNGAFTSDNLDFVGATFTGNNAALNGSADILSGTFTGDWNVTSGSELNMVSNANKIFSTGTFTNEGTVNWEEGLMFLSGGADVHNQSLWTHSGDLSVLIGTGGTFTNDGTFQKTGGTGTSFFNADLINNGTLDAQSGIIRYAGGSKTFNDGTVFTGSGTNLMFFNATFNGGMTSDNLDFGNGTYTGNGAILHGSADFQNGIFTGDWTVANDGTFNIVTVGNRQFSTGTFTNDGTINWSDGSMFLGGGGNVVNNGLFNSTASGNPNWQVTTGGGTFTNNGLFEKAGGAGTTFLSSLDVDNQGTMNVLSGTIALPINFTNDGTLSGTSNFSLSGTLTNNGIIAPGDIGATGTLGLTGNYLQGASGSLATQLASTTMWDMFNVSGSAALGGTLDLSCILTCDINTGDSFVILTSGSALSGMFDNFTTSGFQNGFQYDVFYDYQNNFVRLDILDAGMGPMGAVPEPSTWAMLIFGFGAVGGAMRAQKGRRRKMKISGKMLA